MACYDPRTNKVYGVKKGSLAYWHEKGHQFLFEKGITPEKDVITTFMILAGWASLTMQKFGLSKMFLIIVLSLMLLEELFCWVYAIKKEGEKKWKITN
jgi:hypothetical protein